MRHDGSSAAEAPSGRPGTPDLQGFRRWPREYLSAPGRGIVRLLILGVAVFTVVQVMVQGGGMLTFRSDNDAAVASHPGTLTGSEERGTAEGKALPRGN